MSTIAEHLAVLEAYQSWRWSTTERIRNYSRFVEEAHMFCEVHLREMIAAIDPDEFASARAGFGQKMRDYHPAMADELLEAWRADREAQAAKYLAAHPPPAQPFELATQGDPVLKALHNAYVTIMELSSGKDAIANSVLHQILDGMTIFRASAALAARDSLGGGEGGGA